MHPLPGPARILTFFAVLAACHAPAPGQGWNHLHPNPTFQDLTDLHFIDDQTGWAVGSSGTLLKTTDGAASWTAVPSGRQAHLRMVRFFGKDTGVVVGDSGIVLRTVDGGSRWTAHVPPAYLGTISKARFQDPLRGWAAGNGKAAADGMASLLLRTQDGGLTWTRLGPRIDTAFTSVHFPDSLHGWAVGLKGLLYATVDGGATWTPRVSGTREDLRDVWFPSRDTGWAIGNRKVFLRTVDGGATWVDQKPLFESQEWLGIRFIGKDTGWAWGWDDIHGNRFLYTNHRGSSWYRLDMEGTRPVRSAFFLDGSRGYMAGDVGQVWRTTNGRFVHQLTRDTRADLVAVSMVDRRTGWAIADRGILLETGDGIQWARQPGPAFYRAADIEFLDARHGWLAADSGLFRTRDGGATWSRGVLAAGSAAEVNRLHARDSLVAWAVGYSGLVMKTEDGGLRWERIPVPTQEALHGIRFLDDRLGFAVGNGGALLRTRDGGSTWTAFEGRFPRELFFRDLAFVHPDTGWAVGGVLGSDMAYTTDGGETWVAGGLLGGDLLSIHVADARVWCVDVWGSIYRRVEGNRWLKEEHRLPASLLDIAFLDPDNGVAVGLRGTIRAYSGVSVGMARPGAPAARLRARGPLRATAGSMGFRPRDGAVGWLADALGRIRAWGK